MGQRASCSRGPWPETHSVVAPNDEPASSQAPKRSPILSQILVFVLLYLLFLLATVYPIPMGILFIQS